jgi:hypothetical protein
MFLFFLGLIIITIIVFFSIIKYQDANPEIFYNEITKTYFAPKSKIKIIVNSKSYVNENSDLGNGNAFVKLFSTDIKKDTVYLKTTTENIDFISYKNKKIKFECSQMDKHKLFDYLISISFSNLDKNEIAELRDAMTFINYGPKATFLKGQTKFIEVLK